MAQPASSNTSITPNGPPSAEKMKARIISHMNADHAESLSLYLRHFNKIQLPASSPAKAKLLDIDLTHMTLSSGAGRSIIHFDPPMKSLAEARERAVGMHKESLAGLGLSDTKITEFQTPKSWLQVGFWVFLSWYYISISFRQSLLPPPDNCTAVERYVSHFGWVGWSLDGFVPFLAWLAYTVGPYTMVFAISVHIIESGIFSQKRLRRHQVPRFSGVWWKWMVSCMFDGGATWIRFDTLVREKEAKQKKH